MLEDKNARIAELTAARAKAIDVFYELYSNGEPGLSSFESGLDAYLAALPPAVEAEREACAQIAEAIDSGRGNEKEIARAIRARAILAKSKDNV